MPFGARGGDAAHGAIARQLARRVVERAASEASLELRPVFLVAMPDEAAAPGYLLMGSTPDPALAAQYAASLGASHALTGVLGDEDRGTRVLSLSLVHVDGARVAAAQDLAIAPGALPRAEREVLSWLAHALGVEVANAEPIAASDDAYAAHLAALDEEVNATLLASTDAERSAAAARRARELHLAALANDPEWFEPEKRLLTLAAASLGSADEQEHIAALEALIDRRPRSWRAHYLLGELRRSIGDDAGAIVALEHSHALQPLRDEDRVRLAELYAHRGQPGMAAAHLRAVRPGSTAYEAARAVAELVALARDAERLDRAREALAAGRAADALAGLDALAAGSGPVAAQARRLRLGARHPDLEHELEHAGAVAVAGDLARRDDATRAFARVLDAEPSLWEAHFGLGLLARHAGEPAAAAAAFRRVLELWPEQPDALHELGVALLLTGDESATGVLDRAALLRPDDPGYVADAGYAHLRDGDLAGARERLERALSMDEADPITRTYLAELERVERGP